MTEIRTVEDRLRAEYFQLLPDMQRTLVALDSEVRHLLLEIILSLNPSPTRYEQVQIASRLKECENAIDSLRRRQQARVFDPEKPETYSLSALPDLIGVRVLVFPNHRIDQVRLALQPLLSSWTVDPVRGIKTSDPPIALKYYGRRKDAKTPVTSEIQIVSSLIGHFWDVEHAAVYKTNPKLQGVMRSGSMEEPLDAVYKALRTFEDEFQRLVRERDAP